MGFESLSPRVSAHRASLLPAPLLGARSVEAEEAAGEELLMMERRRICKALVRFAKRTPLQRAVAYHLAAYLPVGRTPS